ncbi:MAG: tyrosine-type recombinase/integrase [Phycisphaerales bacterium]|nr:tyrosine-type recombinase/integrase [Phycisphaerales bacterium]
MEVLNDREASALLEACHPTLATGLRNRALIAVLYRAGLRITEALELRPKDVDDERGCIRVLRGKGGRQRTVGVDAGALEIIQAWAVARAVLGVDGRSPLLCTVYGTRLTDAYVRRLLPKLADKAGIAKRVHAHGLRHTMAAQLREEGVDIGIISKQLGHQSITTTARYLDHIQPYAVIEAMRGRAWGTTTGGTP